MKYIDIAFVVLVIEAAIGLSFALGAFDEKEPAYTTGTAFTVEPAISNPEPVFNFGAAVEGVLMVTCKVGLAMLCILPFLTSLFGVSLPVAAVLQLFVYWLYAKAIAEIREKDYLDSLKGVATRG